MLHSRRKRCPFHSTFQTGVVILALSIACVGQTAGALEFPGPAPGESTARLEGDRLVLQNGVIEATWGLAADRLGPVELVDRMSGRTINFPDEPAFAVTLADGRPLAADQLRLAGKPALARLPARPDSVRLSRRFGGWKYTLPLVSEDGSLAVQWEVSLRDQSNYVRTRLTVRSKTKVASSGQLTLIRAAVPNAQVVGKVAGSPVVAGNFFLACEHPMANNRVEDGRVICSLPRYLPMEPDEPWTATAVVGVVPEGQLRRGFLYYLERERARPYCPFVYYISWFDIAYNDRKMNEAQCLDVIEAFGTELAEKRGVKLDAFVFDDGWDDDRTLWLFHPGFPNGFSPLQTAASRYGAVLGTWISPWGGYSTAKARRLEFGRTQGFETDEKGFSLAGPKYYARFLAVCTEHLKKYGVGYFKFDGVGQGTSARGPGERYGPDIEALLKLIDDLRRIRPELFVNATVGTWPSPYWLWYSDTIWRGAADIGLEGDGTTRQQWLTYRDTIGYRQRVTPAPLYPLNSLKFQSVIYAQLGQANRISNGLDDLIDDIRMAAGSGTQLQEFFVTPKMMVPEGWDAAAEAIGWSRQNSDVLVDSHWIGGDPGRGQVYGFASWSPRKGILVLRNPTREPAAMAVDVQTVFELPVDAPRAYRFETVWSDSKNRSEATLSAGQPRTFDLAPFEVLVLEALPAEAVK